VPRESAASSTNTLALIPTSSLPAAVNGPVVQQQSLEESHQPMDFNPNIQPNGFPLFGPQYSTIPMSNYNDCTINNYFNKSSPSSSQPKKKRLKAFILDSDNEDWTLYLLLKFL
jgi:hypothetical protein